MTDVLNEQSRDLTGSVSPVVIFDSGVGGLSIFDEVRRQLPWLPMVYCSDNTGFPYGPKSEAEVIVRVRECLCRLQESYQPQLVVIACNTASTVVLPCVRQELSVPVVGVVPAIKTAASLSRNHCIGLLATPGTVNRPYINQLIREFASDCDVVRVGSSELVHLAEQQLRGQPVNQVHLAEILSPFVHRSLTPDYIVLGCTHFPLLKAALSACVPDVQWVDSGQAIARRVGHLIKKPDSVSDHNSSHVVVFTQACNTIEALMPALCARNISDIQLLP